MLRLLALAAALVAVLVLAAPASSTPEKALAFPRGVWIGKGTYGGKKAKVGAVDVTIQQGSLSFLLIAYKNGDASGHLQLTIPHATGELTVGGQTGTGEFSITGTFTLDGKTNHVLATGSYTLDGAVVVAGVTAPVHTSVPVENAPFGIKAVKCPQTVSGSWGPYYAWTAKPKPGAKIFC